MFNYCLLSGSAEDTEKKKKYVIFEDSHSKFFMPRKFTVPKPTWLEVHIYRIGGASMAGFGKRESTLQVADKIREAIYNHQNLDLLILKFGHVDVELGYYYRLIVKKENINFLDFAEKIVSLYFDFLKSLACSKKHIHILGINLPSIFRKRNAIRYTNQVITQNIKDRTLVREFKLDLIKNLPDIYERTNRSIIFNEILTEFCQKSNIGYSDFIKETLNQETGILKEKFHPTEDNDPHFKDGRRTRNLYRLRLINFGLEYEQSLKAKVMNPKEKLLETEFVKQQQWQSRLEELKNEIKQMQSSLEKINYKLRNNYDVEE